MIKKGLAIVLYNLSMSFALELSTFTIFSPVGGSSTRCFERFENLNKAQLKNLNIIFKGGL